MFTPRPSFAPWPVILLLVGCLGGDTGTEIDRSSCAERGTDVPVEPNTETVHGTATALAQKGATLGQTGAFMYRRVVGNESVSTSTVLTLTVMPDSSAAWLAEKRDHEDSQRVCDPTLEMDVAVRIETQDGAFNDELHGTLAYDGSRMMIEARLSFNDVQGSYATDIPLQDGTLIANMWMNYSAGSSGETRWAGHLTLADFTMEESVSADVGEW